MKLEGIQGNEAMQKSGGLGNWSLQPRENPEGQRMKNKHVDQLLKNHQSKGHQLHMIEIWGQRHVEQVHQSIKQTALGEIV